MKIITALSLAIPVMLITACKRPENQFPLDLNVFNGAVDNGLLENNDLQEASGLAASRAYPHYYWTHNDHGDQNRIFLLDENGRNKGVFFIQGATNRDWEDIAAAKIDNVPYLYIGDIGDNDNVYDTKYIYRIREPKIDLNALPVTTTLDGVETIKVAYPDGNHNAEALMVDQETNDIYIVTKFEKNVIVYKVAYPQSLTETNQAQKMLTLPITVVTAADISPDNQEILIKNYETIYYWKRQSGESIVDALKRNPVILPYKPEPHGEAVAFGTNNEGYYTVSEVKHKIASHLYFYKRK